jgi:hypothetical protein
MIKEWKKKEQMEKVEKIEKAFFDDINVKMGETEILWYNLNRYSLKPTREVYKEVLLKKKNGNKIIKRI